MSELKIAMLGLGEMNGAILEGALKSGVRPENVAATTRSESSARAAAERFGVRVLPTADDEGANTTAVADADVVFLGVLPPAITTVAAEIKDVVKPDTVIVSVAAGVTTKMVEAALRNEQPVIRTMPNMPLSVGLGAVGLSAGRSASDAQVRTVQELLEASGSVHVIAENLMDQVNGVIGSGPGYLYYLAEQMTRAGVEFGFAPDQAAALAAETLIGASTLLVNQLETDPDAASTLKNNMILPGGTTARAYEVFDEHGVAEGIRAGMHASAERSAEIARELAENE